ncbi:ABC transporter ATP-binding protein [Sporolactobacillus shoreae]|uniref:ABC transporter ATP-binding protein n=1 Tax=Sporolactobacillus shoreae TaxID=1465501 RepID=A0A4Z0GM86_9BACL|nr:ABC transporter ATP-binding protein [Sporolactobacillus shoreae]
MNLIDVQNLHFSYPEGIELLKGIDLAFDHRSTAIIGQNGAGKTTFVKLLKGLLKPVSGDILINGVNTKEISVAKLAAHIGLVFQNPGDQIFKSSVYDEVIFGPHNIGIPEDEADESTKKALIEVGLENKVNDNPYDLSFSERKLISIASILAMNTQIVLLDEPTIAQDDYGKQLIQGLVRKLEGEGRLVISILHDMDFVAETFTRTLVFQNGKVTMDNDTKSVFSQTEAVRRAYLEPPHVTQLGNRLGYTETYLTAEQFVKDSLRKREEFKQ